MYEYITRRNNITQKISMYPKCIVDVRLQIKNGEFDECIAEYSVWDLGLLVCNMCTSDKKKVVFGA